MSWSANEISPFLFGIHGCKAHTTPSTWRDQWCVLLPISSVLLYSLYLATTNFSWKGGGKTRNLFQESSFCAVVPAEKKYLLFTCLKLHLTKYRRSIRRFLRAARTGERKVKQMWKRFYGAENCVLLAKPRWADNVFHMHGSRMPSVGGFYFSMKISKSSQM